MESIYSIKDKLNILTFNQYSCGQYNKNINGFTPHLERYNITDKLTIIQDNPANWHYFDLEVNNIEPNTEYYFEAILKTNTVWNMNYNEGNSIISVTINPSIYLQKISLSFTTANNWGRIRWFNNTNDATLELYELTLYKR